MITTHNTRKKGNTAETLACEHLQAKGLELIQRNYYCALGEIDLIMREGEDLVFVEVRSSGKSNLLNLLESIDVYKQRKIVKTATYFLQQNKTYAQSNCRFDVIGIDNSQQLEWIKNAFDADIF